MTNNSIYSRVTCDCAAGPWHRIDYDKPETLPDTPRAVLCAICYEGYGWITMTDYWGPSRFKNYKNTWELGRHTIEDIIWTHWAEIRLPGEQHE